MDDAQFSANQRRHNFAVTVWRVVIMNWRVSPGLYVVQVVMTVVQGLLPLASAFITGALLGAIAQQFSHPTQPVAPLLWLLAALGVIELIIGQTSYWGFYLDDKFGLQFDIFIQRTLFLQINELDQSYYEDQEFNNQLNKITQNLNSMRQLNRNFLMAGNSVVQLVSTAIALVSFEPLIALAITLALIPVLVVEVRTSVGQWRSWDRRGNEWRLAWYLRGLLTNVVALREVKLFGGHKYLLELWQGHLTSARTEQLSIERVAQRWRAGTGLLSLAVSFGSQAWLLLRVLARGSGLGGFVFYRQVMDNYGNAGSSLVRNLHTMQESSLYVNDFFELMELKPRLSQPAQARRLPEVGAPPRIEFEDVSFTYPGTEAKVLRGVSFVLEPGQDLAIVGDNGAGKTTLVKLLLRLYDPTAGRILIDGSDLREIDLAGWYRRLGPLFQDFNRYRSLTVRENILMGRAGRRAEQREVEAAARQAGADRFIQNYARGYGQLLDRSFDGGTDPSGGQWQRIALARAFYRNASVLILDEPTSAIDAQGEYEIFQRIAKTQRSKSTIIISHRFSTVRNANSIIVLEGGKVTERGSHEQLLELKGRYHDLFEMQAQGYR